jgi:hypothetical protein
VQAWEGKEGARKEAEDVEFAKRVAREIVPIIIIININITNIITSRQGSSGRGGQDDCPWSKGHAKVTNNLK